MYLCASNLMNCKFNQEYFNNSNSDVFFRNSTFCASKQTGSLPEAR